MTYDADRFIQHILRFIYFTCNVWRTSAIGMVRKHNLPICTFQLGEQFWTIPGEEIRRSPVQSYSETHFNPEIAIAFSAIYSAAPLPTNSRRWPSVWAAMASLTPSRTGMAVSRRCNERNRGIGIIKGYHYIRHMNLGT